MEGVSIVTEEAMGKHLKNAIQWISDKRQYEPETCGPLGTLIEQAGRKFDLSPKDEEFLFRFLTGKE
jgi:hypothetical protein